jgi:RNA polymerase sigma factor (TIGR02999 family)
MAGPPSCAYPLTALLQAWGQGDSAVADQLFEVVYDELHRIASRRIRREPPGNTLEPSALVNEAYVRLIDARNVDWQDRAHFFALAARIMRRILVDAARRKAYAKRGGNAQRQSFEETMAVGPQPSADLVALDDALDALATVDERKSKVVELRFFGGLSVDETASVLKISRQSVLRDWSLAKVWLARELVRAGAL